MSRITRTVLWLCAVVTAIVLLRVTATGDLAPPPISSLDGLSAWAETRTPTAAAVALVRLGAELAAWYLLALSVLHVVSRAPGLYALRRLADGLSVAGSRRVLSLAMGLTAATATPWTGANEMSGPVVVAEAQAADDAALAAPAVPDAEVGANPHRRRGPNATMVPLGRESLSRPGTATMRPSLLDTAGPGAAPTPGVARMVPHPQADDGPGPQRTGPSPDHWTVHDGESFWSIAGQILDAAPPAEAEATTHDRYWRSLIEANRDRLADPSNPDLIYPGQVFVVPPVGVV